MREVNHGTPAPRYLFPQEKTTVEAATRIEDDFQGILGQHLLDLLRKASDRGDLARYVGNNIGVREKGGGESKKGMRYPSRRRDSTQESTPIVCQCLQCADRQSPHPQHRRDPVRKTSSRPLFICYRSGWSRRKGRFTLATPLLPTLLGSGRGWGRRSLLLLPRNHG